MNFETEKIFFNQIIAQKKEPFSIEDNIIIPDVKPDILSVISSSANVYVYRKELVNGRIKIDGGIQIDIIYLADDESNNIRGLHTVLDFSKSIDVDKVNDNFNFSCCIHVKSIEPKILNGRKINIKANVEVDATLYSNEQKQFVKSIQNTERVQMISRSVKINSLKGKGETVCSAKDTISIDDNLADILSCDIFVKNKDLKISYNKVLSKADSVFEILYLTEEEQIKSVTAQIPIMGFIDITDISDNEMCNTNYEIRNINIKPNSVEEHSISIEVEFFITCEAYEEKEINLIQDLYSPEEELIMDQEEVNLMKGKKNICDSCNLNEKINLADVKDNKIYNMRYSTNIVKQNVLNNSISYECELVVSALYESNITGRMEEKEQKIDFTHVVNIDGISKNTKVNTTVEIQDKDFSFSPDNLISLNVNMNFNLDTYEANSVKLVNNIKVEQVSSSSRCSSLVIYYVKDGDTLWKIAKKFKSTIDEIAQINNIENVDKLNVGDQLFIPKYVGNKVS